MYIEDKDLKLKINQLQDYKKGELMLLPLRYIDRSTYLVKDTGKDMPIEYVITLKETMEELAGRGASVLYVTTEDGLPNPRSIKDQPLLLLPTPYWKNKIEYLKTTMSPNEAVISLSKKIQDSKKEVVKGNV
jgi:hypothetical protein